MSFIGSMQLKSCNYTLFEAQLIWKTAGTAASAAAAAATVAESSNVNKWKLIQKRDVWYKLKMHR